MKRKSILKILIKVIYGAFKTCLICFLLVFALLVCLQRFSNNSVALFNYRMFSVVTGSMVPMYDIGDVLICKEVDVETLKVGDDISYFGKTGAYKDKVITHRIIKIETDENGELSFYTKGIATKTVDPIVKEDQIYGKITKKATILSALYKFISTPSGFYIAIIVPIVLLIGSEIIVTMFERARDKKIAKKAKKEEAKELPDNADSQKEAIEKEIAEIQRKIEEKKKEEIKKEIERLQKEIDQNK